MTNYGLNFGFRRSGGDSATREGKYKVPADLLDLRQGEVVEIDTTKPGFIKRAASNVALREGWSGLVIQEEGWLESYFAAPQRTTHDMGFVRPGLRCAIWTGKGLLIWLKNTPAVTRAGRAIPARTVVATGLVVGDNVVWDGTKFAKAPGTGSPNIIGRVTQVAGTAGAEYAEIVLS